MSFYIHTGDMSMKFQHKQNLVQTENMGFFFPKKEKNIKMCVDVIFIGFVQMIQPLADCSLSVRCLIILFVIYSRAHQFLSAYII